MRNNEELIFLYLIYKPTIGMDHGFCVCYQPDDSDSNSNSVSTDRKTRNISHQSKTRKTKKNKNKMKKTQFKMMEQSTKI